MDSYEEKMYKYLFSKDNFKIAYEINQIFPNLKNKLIFDFWSEFKNKVEQICKNEWDSYLKINGNQIGGNLEIKSSSNIICIKKKEWKNLSIAFEQEGTRLFYGIRLPSGPPLIDNEKLIEYVNNLEKSPGKPTEWWPWWKYCSDFDFYQEGTLINILPDTRDQKLNELTNILFNLANTIYKKNE